MVPPPLIVPAGPDAASALAVLHAAAFEAPWTAIDLQGLIASPFTIALQAGAPAAPVGFTLARVVAGEAEILTLAVDPAARGRGIARALVEAAAGLAHAAGARTMWLEVAQDNSAALALYAVAGFEEAGRRKGYYPRKGGPVDALSLRRRLNSAPA
ncbi:GNAT family N-acetyltransferase [Caulobacter sp. S45]|uniref:GNAT family N-acetyltransferase n=1 Tax=Caulobacter sp. S45 TaxID=1641861 RepID=UPI0020C736A7|nr:GNAT family N-acetyltransferase [Caulobacter sp. S45]